MQWLSTVWCKCLMVQNFDKINGVISDFEGEYFDECFCLPVKRAIILLLLLLHALVSIIATPCHVAHSYFVADKHPKGSGKLSFGVLGSFYLRRIDILQSFATTINTDALSREP